MSRTIDRTNAKRYAAIFQIGALACVLGAVAVGVIGLPGLEPPSELMQVSETAVHQQVQSSDASEPSTTDQYRHSMDPRSVADRLSLADNAPELPKSEPDVVENETSDQVEEPAPSSGALMKRLRYLGYISEGKQPLAFVRFDSRQHIVRPGQQLNAGDDAEGGDAYIVTIGPEFLVARENEDGLAIKIPLKEKIGPSIAVVTTQPELDVGSLDPSEITPAMIRAVELTPEEIESLSGLLPHERALQERVLKRQKLGLPTAFERNKRDEIMEKALRVDVFRRNRSSESPTTDPRRQNEEAARERDSGRD